MAEYRFERQGRSPATAFGAVLYVGTLVSLWLMLGASLLVMILLSLFAVPAIVDLIRNPKSGMILDEDTLRWYHGRISNTLPLNEIERLRLDLRFDRSLKLSAELKNGKKIRVVQPALPPLSELEQALQARGIPYRKNPCSLL